MFVIGDKVLYGSHGVCCVEGMEEKSVDRKQVRYLVLEPVTRDGSKYMVPTHNALVMSRLQHLLPREELDALFHSQGVHVSSWIPNENERKGVYRELLASGERQGLMRMVYTLYGHRAAQQAAGRKCHLCDENFLRDAEKLLGSEVSEVLCLEPMAARAYIRDALKP